MEEISALFKTTVLDPSETENIEDKGFESLYKNWGKLGQQEQRRRDTLENQKSHRNSRLDTCRGILELVNVVEQEDFEKPYQGLSTNNRRYRPSIYVAGFTKTSTSYKDVLMMSEWMVEKPGDFSDNWYVVPCPKGVRMLVVACNGNTKFYNKYGLFRKSCSTALPGGNPRDMFSFNSCTVLDCFYVETTGTMYVLDLLAWKNQPMSDGETEFRHFWMKTHIEEIPELKKISPSNKVLFEVLPKIDCSQESFNKFMMTLPHFKDHTPNLDGLLFYHKFAQYVAGVTPLVGWLYPFMVNEVLGSDITVNPGYLVGRPIGYVNQAQFIQEFDSKVAQKTPRFVKTANSMDTSSESDAKGDQKKRRQRKHKPRQTDAEMQNSTEMDVWQPTATTFQSWPEELQPETIKPRLTKIRPSTE